MTASPDLLDLVASALTQRGVAPLFPWPTDAQDRVLRPGILPTQEGQYPVVKLRLVTESRQSSGRGTVQFTTVPTIRITGEVSAPVSMSDPNISEVEARLWRLKRQIEMAVINNLAIFREVQQLLSVQTQFAYAAEATLLAGIQSDYAFETYEGPEDFAPNQAEEVDGIDLSATHYPPAGLTADLSQ